MLERRNKMFVVGNPGPASSGMPTIKHEERSEYLMLAASAVSEKEWPKADVLALSASFGNFDRVVALPRLSPISSATCSACRCFHRVIR